MKMFIMLIVATGFGLSWANRDLLVLPYYRTTNSSILGKQNYGASLGNPLKGLAGGARWSTPPLPDSVPLSIEFYNLGLDEMMVGYNNFDWTTVENILQSSASRKMHSVLSVYIHWPGQPLRLPPHLRNIKLYDTDNGKSPNYGDPRVLTALQQFITAFGERFDGDRRIAAIHIGLLGFWGEGHTYPDLTLVPETSKQSVAQWYWTSFSRTQIQARYPGSTAEGFGLYDGSLAYQSLDGIDNGNVEHEWFMWPRIQQAGQQVAWKKSMMGGETRPELQSTIFTYDYPAGTEWHQNFKKCIETMHISYVLHHDAFQNDGYQGDMLKLARAAHSYMGYSYYVAEVAAYASSNVGYIDVGITIVQSGVAPFYYDLSLILECSGTKKMQDGVNDIVEKGQWKLFLFRNVPASSQCLKELTVKLHSSYAYEGRPIVFAQGSDGSVSFAIPMPKNLEDNTARSKPVTAPARAIVSSPKTVPQKAPARAPRAGPVKVLALVRG
jgi:hypothetical protein